jgi:hypothetical protein
MKNSSQRGFVCYEKRCNSKTLWLRYYKKEKASRKTKEMKKENEAILKS